MAMSLEEVLKLEKDKSLEVAYKNVRQALKLSISKFVTEASGGNFEKYICTFAGCDGATKSTAASSTERPSIIDELLNLSVLMESVFTPLGDLSEGRLAYKLSTVSSVNIERVILYAKDVRINSFPHHKERYSYGVSEAQEAKAIIPRQALRAIKMIVDKYYFAFRVASINQASKLLFNKLGIIRERLLTFEWYVYENQRKLEKDYQKELGAFGKDLKLSLLYIKKLLEAVDASNFGKLVSTLLDLTRETGFRMFIKHNEVITIRSKLTNIATSVRVKYIIDQFDFAMSPIRKSLNDIDANKVPLTNPKSLQSIERQKAFWEISDKITIFRDSMTEVITEFGKGLPPSDEDYKFFSYTIQSTIIPYVSQAKGELNDTFLVAIKNADKFFWKVMKTLLERSTDDLVTMEEILGLQIKVTKADYERIISERGLDPEAIVDFGIDNPENPDKRQANNDI